MRRACDDRSNAFARHVDDALLGHIAAAHRTGRRRCAGTVDLDAQQFVVWNLGAIAPSDRPLGTHVFTAEADKKDPNLLRWSVVSLPIAARHAARIDEDDRSARRRKMAGGAAAEAKRLPAPNSPAEALDRIAIAPEAIARIAEALNTGGSIVVSDHGINQGGETGEGTDFIVPLR